MWAKNIMHHLVFDEYLKLLKTYDKKYLSTTKECYLQELMQDLGILVEPNILERAREIVGVKQPTFENTYYEERLVMTSSISESADYKMLGQPLTFN